MKRIAVLIRTHVMNDLVIQLYRQMDELAPINIDIYLCSDVTRGDLSAPDGFKVEPHTAGDAERLGLLPFPPRKILWYNGDYPLYFFHDTRPDYDLYMMVEYDVFFTNVALQHFFRHLVSVEADYLGIYVKPARAGWQWAEAARVHYDQVYSSFFPIVGLSKSAILKLQHARKTQAENYLAGRIHSWTHCEAFVPTEVFALGLSVNILNEHLKILPSKFSTSRQTLVCSDLLEISSTSDELYHPALPHQEFLKSLVNHAGSEPFHLYLLQRPQYLKKISQLERIRTEKILEGLLDAEISFEVKKAIFAIDS